MSTDYSATLFIIGKWHTKVHKKVTKKYKTTTAGKFKKVAKKHKPTLAEKLAVEDDEDDYQAKKSYTIFRIEYAMRRMRMRKPGRINRRGIADMRYEGTGWTYPFRK